jgi:uncharacterized protein with PIN domain
MTVDARSLVAILHKGPGYEIILDAVAKDDAPRICATALVEAAIILRARGDMLAEMTIESAIYHLNLTVMPFTESDWRTASKEHQRQVKANVGTKPTLGECLTAAIAANTGADIC